PRSERSSARRTGPMMLSWSQMLLAIASAAAAAAVVGTEAVAVARPLLLLPLALVLAALVGLVGGAALALLVLASPRLREQPAVARLLALLRRWPATELLFAGVIR